MRKMISQLGMALALASLVGCGLKGPLYFPPQEKSTTGKQQVTEQQKKAAQNADVNGLVTSKPGMQAN
ncbi:lipoprotein [Pantoea sp. Mb-10]|uniref:LPS translocon maturation chaperone LptM n=1 Tax=unclassified Pantoea TaxID=2630326 RepID=UPI001E417D98|nr:MULTISPECIES: lipoprotein [unclassified Pantoea]MCE0491657.1 lipoprotein [Pantoea sp. Mb-10]MCE0502844.1 lipoprotein [Pantoea sp. Pb-8]